MATFRKQPSGKITAEVCVKGVRKSKTFDSRAKARNWASETEIELSKSGGVSGAHTLGDVFHRYGAEISPGKKGCRWELVRLAKFAGYPIAEVKLSELQREDFDIWIEERRREGVMASSINRELNLLSHCLTWARRWRLMTGNPMTDLHRPKNPPARDRRILPDEEALVLVSLGYAEGLSVQVHAQRVAVAFLLALETGMRAGELCSITPENYNEAARTVYLPETKNGLPRKVPLSTRAVTLINSLQPFDDGPIFRMRSGTLSTIFKSAVSKTGIVGLTFHDTRHEAITRLAKKLGVLDLARMVGHRDIRQLQTYYNKSAEELAQQLD